MKFLADYEELAGKTIVRTTAHDSRHDKYVALWCSDGSALVMGIEYDYDAASSWGVEAEPYSNILSLLGFDQDLVDALERERDERNQRAIKERQLARGLLSGAITGTTSMHAD